MRQRHSVTVGWTPRRPPSTRTDARKILRYSTISRLGTGPQPYIQPTAGRSEVGRSFCVGRMLRRPPGSAGEGALPYRQFPQPLVELADPSPIFGGQRERPAARVDDDADNSALNR